MFTLQDYEKVTLNNNQSHSLTYRAIVMLEIEAEAVGSLGTSLILIDQSGSGPTIAYDVGEAGDSGINPDGFPPLPQGVFPSGTNISVNVNGSITLQLHIFRLPNI